MRRPIQDVFIKCARHCHCLCRRMGNAIMYLFFCVCEPVGRNLCARRLLDVLLAFVQLLLLHHRNRFRNKKCVDVCAAYAFSFRLAQSIQQRHEHIVSPVAGRRSPFGNCSCTILVHEIVCPYIWLRRKRNSNTMFRRRLTSSILHAAPSAHGAPFHSFYSRSIVIGSPSLSTPPPWLTQ